MINTIKGSKKNGDTWCDFLLRIIHIVIMSVLLLVDKQSKFNNKSFIEFVSEDEIQKSLSENCVGCFVHKYSGTLRQDVVRYFKHRRYADIRRRRNQPPGSIYLKKSLQRPPIPFK